MWGGWAASAPWGRTWEDSQGKAWVGNIRDIGLALAPSGLRRMRLETKDVGPAAGRMARDVTASDLVDSAWELLRVCRMRERESDALRILFFLDKAFRTLPLRLVRDRIPIVRLSRLLILHRFPSLLFFFFFNALRGRRGFGIKVKIFRFLPNDVVRRAVPEVRLARFRVLHFKPLALCALGADEVAKTWFSPREFVDFGRFFGVDCSGPHE